MGYVSEALRSRGTRKAAPRSIPATLVRVLFPAGCSRARISCREKPQQRSIACSIPAAGACCELVLAPGEAKTWDYVVSQQRALGRLVEQRDL